MLAETTKQIPSTWFFKETETLRRAIGNNFRAQKEWDEFPESQNEIDAQKTSWVGILLLVREEAVIAAVLCSKNN